MKYRVKNTDLKHNDKFYPEGSIIELTNEEAEALIAVLEEIKTAEEDEEKQENKSKGGKK